jgi:hypothetical protein
MTISINYFNPTYRQDQQTPFNVTANGLTRQPLWDAMGISEFAGEFEPRLGNSTTLFTPLNRSQTVKVRVFDTVKPTWTNVSSTLAFSGETIAYAIPGTPGVFYGATGSETCVSGDCFVETRVEGPMWSRGLGLSAAPHNYGWNHPDLDYSIALGQVGAGSIWISGVSVLGAFSDKPGFIYQVGDIIRIAVEDHKVCFRKNGELLYQHTPGTDPVNLQPIVTFYDYTSQVGEVRFWQAGYGKAEAPMQVWGVLPVCQDKMSEHEVLEAAEVSEAEAQRGQDKVVRYHQQQDKWDLVFSGRRFSELAAIRDFRAFHRLHIPFYISDQARALDKLVVFDTGIKDRLIQSNMFDFSCTVKEY